MENKQTLEHLYLHTQDYAKGRDVEFPEYHSVEHLKEGRVFGHKHCPCEEYKFR